MINRMIHINQKVLFIDVSENLEERAHLVSLARQSRYFATICKKTGLHITLEMPIDDIRLVLVMTVKEAVELTSKELQLLEQQCLETVSQTYISP